LAFSVEHGYNVPSAVLKRLLEPSTESRPVLSRYRLPVEVKAVVAAMQADTPRPLGTLRENAESDLAPSEGESWGS
jgi:hypothetical protein